MFIELRGTGAGFSVASPAQNMGGRLDDGTMPAGATTLTEAVIWAQSRRHDAAEEPPDG